MFTNSGGLPGKVVNYTTARSRLSSNVHTQCMLLHVIATLSQECDFSYALSLQMSYLHTPFTRFGNEWNSGERNGNPRRKSPGRIPERYPQTAIPHGGRDGRRYHHVRPTAPPRASHSAATCVSRRRHVRPTTPPTDNTYREGTITHIIKDFIKVIHRLSYNTSVD